MKKSLLTISATLLTGLAASAAGPVVMEECFPIAVSPNGEWGVNSMYAEAAIVNLKTGQQTVVEGEVYASPAVCIANNGSMVYSDYSDVSYIVINGESIKFDSSELLEYRTIILNGISADATRVVGVYTPVQNTRGTMDRYPAMWEIDEHGKVLSVTKLPCPEKDFTGQIPQSSNALAISEDGKTILGNVIDNRGYMPQPIIYKQADDGTWAYSLPASSLINPDGVEFPEIGEEPPYVQVTDFMGEEQKEKYQEALDEYWAEYMSGNTDAVYPDATDYLTEEELAAFEEAANAYNTWLEEFYEILAIYDEEVMPASTVFETNAETLSPDGNFMAALSYKAVIDPADPWTEIITYQTVSFNLETGEISFSPEGQNFCPNQVLDGGVIIATDSTAGDGLPQISYIRNGYDAEFVPIYDYYKETNPEVAEWIYENFKKEFVVENLWMGTVTEYDGIFTGETWMSKDRTVAFAGVASIYWDEETTYTSYIINELSTGISNVAVGTGNDIKISAVRGGQINIAGDATRVTVYDLSGRAVFSAPAAATVATGLNGGAYIVKVDSANGSKTAKVTF